MATLTIADLDNGKRDLKTVSEVANSRAATTTTRFGEQTTTLYEAIRRISADGEAQLDEQKTAAEEVIRSLGFRVPVEYAPGLDVTDSRLTVTGPDGKVYAPLSAPFTAGAWDPTQWYVLQNDLNDHKLLVFNSYAAASAAAATLPDGQLVDVEDERYKVQAGELVFEHLLSDATVVSYTASAGGSVTTTVQEKLEALVSASDFGVTGNGTDESSKLQNSINHVASLGGGTITLPPKTIRAKNISMKNNVKLLGSRGATVLKVPDGFDAQILSNSGQSSGEIVAYFDIEGIIFDGNKSLSPRAVATSAVGANIVVFFRAKDCAFRNSSGYGLAMQGQPGYSSVAGPQLDVYLENCYFDDNGGGAIGGTDKYDGIDIKTCRRLTMVNCYANRNSDQGINVRGQSVTIVGGASKNNGSNGYGFSDNPNGDQMTSYISVHGASAIENANGFSIAQTTVDSTQSVKVTLSGCFSYLNTGYGISTGSYNDYADLIVTGGFYHNNGLDGAYFAGDMRNVSLIGASFTDNSGSGVATNASRVMLTGCELRKNSRYGFEEKGTGTRNSIAGSCRVYNNGLGPFLLGTNRRTVISDSVLTYDVGSGDTIASTETINLPESGRWFAITGTTTITSIQPSWRGRVVTLQFNGALTVIRGNNLALSGNFVTSSADTLTLVCDGSSWVEVSRSVN